MSISQKCTFNMKTPGAFDCVRLSLPITLTFSNIALSMSCFRKDICGVSTPGRYSGMQTGTVITLQLKLVLHPGTLQYQLGKRSLARHSWNAIRFKVSINSEGSRAVLESIRLEVESGKARYHHLRQLVLNVTESNKAHHQAL